jgi:hypothetical protein
MRTKDSFGARKSNNARNKDNVAHHPLSIVPREMNVFWTTVVHLEKANVSSMHRMVAKMDAQNIAVVQIPTTIGVRY